MLLQQLFYESPAIRSDGVSVVDESQTGDVRPVQPGRAALLDGTSQYFEGSQVVPSFTLPLTCYVMFKVTDLDTIQFITETHGTVTKYAGVRCFVATSGKFVCQFGNNVDNGPLGRMTANSSLTVTPNEWTLAVFVMRGPSDVSIYINNVEDTGITYSGDATTLVLDDSPIRIGNNLATTDVLYFKGHLSEFRLYDRELTTQEIDDIWQQFDNPQTAVPLPAPLFGYAMDGMGSSALDIGGTTNVAMQNWSAPTNYTGQDVPYSLANTQGYYSWWEGNVNEYWYIPSDVFVGKTTVNLEVSFISFDTARQLCCGFYELDEPSFSCDLNRGPDIQNTNNITFTIRPVGPATDTNDCWFDAGIDLNDGQLHTIVLNFDCTNPTATTATIDGQARTLNFKSANSPTAGYGQPTIAEMPVGAQRTTGGTENPLLLGGGVKSLRLNGVDYDETNMVAVGDPWIAFDYSRTPEFTGVAPRDGRLLQSPAMWFNGVNMALTVAELVGNETVVSSQGTAVPTVAAGQITFTAGTCWLLELSNGSIYPMSEGNLATVYDISGNQYQGTQTNYDAVNSWGTSQDLYHHSILYGCSPTGVDPDIVDVPGRTDASGLDALGNPLGAPADKFNNDKSQIDFTNGLPALSPWQRMAVDDLDASIPFETAYVLGDARIGPPHWKSVQSNYEDKFYSGDEIILFSPAWATQSNVVLPVI